jgi:hypothetical protein
MVYQSQKNPNWAEKFLGTSRTIKFKNAACFLTSFCNLGIINNWFTFLPNAMNDLFIKNELWVNQCNINLQKIADFFGLHYEEVYNAPNITCIAETDHFSPSQHFFVWRPEDCNIIDPLDIFPTWKKNNYHIVSYRILTKNAQMQIPIKTNKPEIKYITTGYVVKKGETLWSISQDFYGDGSMWAKIAKANNLTNFNKIKVGQVLKIPGFE